MIYNPSFPEILQTKFKITNDVRQRMIDAVFLQKDTGNCYGGYTFHILDNEHGDFKQLYNYSLGCVEKMFGKLVLAPKNRSWCWVNIYNKDSFRTNLHNHNGTCSINVIYYLKMPTDIGANEGGLLVLKDDQLYITFQPAEDDLIIMPSYVPHQPQYHSSNDYRIAINMEITTIMHNSKYYTKENVYTNATCLL